VNLYLEDQERFCHTAFGLEYFFTMVEEAVSRLAITDLAYPSGETAVEKMEDRNRFLRDALEQHPAILMELARKFLRLSKMAEDASARISAIRTYGEPRQLTVHVMPTILTIGYQQATQPAVLSALREAGVEVLADIRARPLSRKPGFSKTALKAAVEEAGMEYRHFRDVGTPPEGREAARKGDKATLARVYAGQLELPEALAAMAELRQLAQEKRTALLCFCREADKCHRNLLVAELFPDFTRLDLEPALVSP